MAGQRPRIRFLAPVVATVVIGVVAGLVAVAFAEILRWMQKSLLHEFLGRPILVFGGSALVVMVLGALVSGCLMHWFAKDAAGSGIPQVKVAYQRGEIDFSWKLIFVKFVGGVCAIGTGSSLGREGPTVHMGAAFASKIARWFHESPDAKLNAVCAGSAAGLAVAFNSPLAGVTLVLEEIAGGRNQEKFAGRSLLAAAMGVLMVYLFRGDIAEFQLEPGIPLTPSVAALSPIVALFAGLSGVFFQWGTLKLRGRMKSSNLHPALRPATGAVVGCLAAVAAFVLTGHLGVFGLGEQDLLAALDNKVLWWAAGALLLAKIIATMFCYGSGGCGGIFAPLIFFGGMAGAFVAGISGFFLTLTPGDQTMMSIIGMTACLCSVVRAPITSILIVTEMTREVYALPGLMVAAVIGAFLNRYCLLENFYDAAIRQDGIVLNEH